MGDLAIAIAVISSFAFDTARWLAFGQTRFTVSAPFTESAFKTDQRMIRSRLFLAAVLPMPKQSLGDWATPWLPDTAYAIVLNCLTK